MSAVVSASSIADLLAGALLPLVVPTLCSCAEHTSTPHQPKAARKKMPQPGALFTWGRGKDGRLGLADGNADHSDPVAVPGLHGVPLTHVALGNCHGGAIGASGEVYVWGGGAFGELGLGERMQAQDGHASCERVGQARHEQDVRRTREKEATGAPVAVDGRLDGCEDPGGALNLVQYAVLGEIVHEPDGVVGSRFEVDPVVEAHVGIPPSLADFLRQRRLAALAGAVQENHG